MANITSELESLIEAFDPTMSPRYAKWWNVRVHRRISMFDKGKQMHIYAVAWYPAVGSKGHVYEPFRTELYAHLKPTVWLSESRELVTLDHFHQKYLMRELSELPDEAKQQLLQGLRGEFAELDRRLEEGRKALAQSEADRIIRAENKRIAALTPLQRLAEKSEPFDENAADYPVRRRQIVEALLA